MATVISNAQPTLIMSSQPHTLKGPISSTYNSQSSITPSNSESSSPRCSAPPPALSTTQPSSSQQHSSSSSSSIRQQHRNNSPSSQHQHHQRNGSITSNHSIVSNAGSAGAVARLQQQGLPPHMQPQPKQLRPPRSPLYVPSVLRPTEKPIRNSPTTPNNPAHRHKRNDTRASLVGDPLFPLSPLDERDSAISPVSEEDLEDLALSIRRVVTEEWIGSSSRPVAGPPLRNHWKLDTLSEHCEHADCTQTFSVFHRRHHCRRCGSIFCAQHSQHTIPLDEYARFHSLAEPYRSCDDCYRDYRMWDKSRLQRLQPRNNGGSDTSSVTDGDTKTTNNVDVQNSSAGKAINVMQQPKKGGIISAIAQSVPRDWNWSTF